MLSSHGTRISAESFASLIDLQTPYKRQNTSTCSLDSVSSTDAPTCRICHCTQSEDNSSKLICPCKCSGTLSHVHIRCLQSWRATSDNANISCSICSHRYEIRRTMLASILLSPYSPYILTAFFILAADVLLGLTLFSLDVTYIKVDIASIVFNVLGVQPWWRVYRPWTDILTIAQGWNFSVLFCNKDFSNMLDVTVLGTSCIGVIGFGTFIRREINRLHMIGGPDGLHRVLALGVWLCSVGNRVLSRFCFVIGTAVATSAMYFAVLEYGRKYAQSLGERIIEPVRGKKLQTCSLLEANQGQTTIQTQEVVEGEVRLSPVPMGHQDNVFDDEGYPSDYKK